MLTLYSNSSIVHLPVSRIHRVLGEQKLSNSVFLDSVAMKSFLSLLDGERKIDTHPLHSALLTLGIWTRWVMSECTVNDIGGRERTLVIEEPERITLECSDGRMEVSSTYLDYFAVLKDFSSEFPGQPIPIPYTTRAVRAAINFNSRNFLISCYECLCHLNPFSNLLYFEFNFTGVSHETVKNLASRLTQEERRTLVEIYHQENSIPLPRGGETHYILAACANVRSSATMCWSLFADQPHWRFLTWINLFDPDERPYQVQELDSLLSTDWSQGDFYRASPTVAWKVQKYLYNLLPLTRNWDEAGKVLAMMGLQSKDLLNEELDVIPPLGLYGDSAHCNPTERLNTHLSSIYPKEWHDNYYANAWSALYLRVQ